MKMGQALMSAIALGAAFAYFAMPARAETQWAPPNVPGMPGYHETVAKPEVHRPAVNWDTIAGNWKQFAGKVKEKWGKLTDDDITRINGQREQLEGALQERYGYSKEQVRHEVDQWVAPD
ncbi:MAG: CsbD family protein [Methylocystis sp.]|uniref:CsbD family protein n=1 Tax=Methylocystis sp. TaxID=1911079 RepID=UPI0039433B39